MQEDYKFKATQGYLRDVAHIEWVAKRTDQVEGHELGYEGAIHEKSQIGRESGWKGEGRVNAQMSGCSGGGESECVDEGCSCYFSAE